LPLFAIANNCNKHYNTIPKIPKQLLLEITADSILEAMEFQHSPYAIPVFVSAAVVFGLAAYAFYRRTPKEARTLGWLMLAVGVWSFCNALSILGTTLKAQLIFNRLKYFGVLATPPLWLILALQYSQRNVKRSWKHIALIFTPSIILLIIVLTDAWTHWWWPEVALMTFDGHPALYRTHGIIYYVHIFISYAYIVTGLLLYIRFYRNVQRSYRRQATIMVIAAVVPLLASAITNLGLITFPWSLDMFFFTLSGFLIAWAIFHYQWLDIIPVARQTILEQLPFGIIVVNAQHSVVDANPAAQTLAAVNEDSLIGHPLLNNVHPALRENLNPILNTPDAHANCAVQISNSQGNAVLSVEVTHLQQNGGRPQGHIIILRDITEQIAVQHELERLAQMKEEFVSTVSHDLRSPLTSVLGYAEIARNPAATPEMQQNALQRIVASAKSMRELVNDLLDLAQIEADVEITREKVTLDMLAKSAIEVLEGTTLDKGLSFVLELTPVPPVLMAPRRIAQVWRNLIDNAIKYTPSGTITIRTSFSSQEVVGEVSDTGVGIPSEAIPFVFDKFYRVSNTEIENIVGTGLGLSLVKSIIEQHNGRITVKSEEGVGSTFSFTLPR
jgi:PAS domain S-box-containing protein